MSGFHYPGLDYSSNAVACGGSVQIQDRLSQFPAYVTAPADTSLIDAAQLAAMFAKLDAYGKRVLLAQAAAMLRVQAGA